MLLERNRALDASALAECYRRDGRVQIKDFLTADSAIAMEDALRSAPWDLVYRDGRQVAKVSADQLRTLRPDQASQIAQAVQSGARSGFQFLYNCYPLLERYFTVPQPSHEILRAFEFLNAGDTRDFLMEVTGLTTCRWLDGQGALYQAGHFLKCHDDESKTEPRLAAYVLGFARDWDADWGGLLQFWDADDDISFAMKPRFNCLNIFSVPCRHSVSQVASWSPGLRFSITGWLRADAPPALPGSNVPFNRAL